MGDGGNVGGVRSTDATPKKVAWENRIVGWDTVDPDQLLANPKNFRRHPAKQREALRGSLSDLGWIAPVVVNRLSGHLVDGHARVEEALTKGCAVPVAYVELTDAEEAEALAVLDPISAMATVDAEALDALLREVATGDAGIQQMLADLAKDAGLYGDASLDNALDFTDELEYRIVVECAGEEDQARLLNQFEQQGIACRALIS